jgi:tRNA 2-selenouridine synthase
VRSPGEFADTFHNLELFSDEERAVVGTAIKVKERAIEIGFEYVKPTNDFVTKSVAIASNKEVAIHCWRGGSNAFADHLIENGFEKVYVIEKGYKAFHCGF